MIIDCHGHYTTAPEELGSYRDAQRAELEGDPIAPGRKGVLGITDQQIRDSLEGAQLAMQAERGTDLTLFSPRASWMGDRTWYPFYEKMCELDVPAMVHVSAACNPAFHTTGSHYLGADTTAFMQMLTSDLLADFPTIRFIIPHGGGAVPYHWGRFRGLVQAMGKPPLEELVLDNVFFDTCVYHQPGIDLLLEVIPAQNVLFASELLGAVRGIDPHTGHHFDDTRRYIDGASVSHADRARIFSENARRVLPRLTVG